MAVLDGGGIGPADGEGLVRRDHAVAISHRIGLKAKDSWSGRDSWPSVTLVQ